MKYQRSNLFFLIKNKIYNRLYDFEASKNKDENREYLEIYIYKNVLDN